jgi:tetratricopeptide (TPR) repeat protein
MKTSPALLAAWWLALGVTTPALAQDTVHASHGQITLPTYPWAAVKHPYFRGTDRVNIYPYPMLDFLSRDKADRTYRTVLLENEYLRVTFLPELGGKIHEVIDKTTGQPMFYVNNVIKPALIGQAGAWTSGGVEWNTGPQGHTVGCMQPVPVLVLPRARDGSLSVAIGETERIYGTQWTVIVTLRPGRSFLEERIRIYNPTPTIRPYYFWNCTAVPNTPGFRFIYPMTLGTDHGAEQFFRWPIHEGKDLTYGTNYQDASSIFAWYCDQDFFGSYNNDLDRGIVAYGNHHQLPGKKAWTWGWGGYGTMHQADLTDDDGPYNEVQTGPLLTQGEVGRLDPGESVEWQEWWYPIHGLGGFTFANKDVAIETHRSGNRLELRLLGSGTWSGVRVELGLPGLRRAVTVRCDVSPRTPTRLSLELPEALAKEDWCFVTLDQQQNTLAHFQLPLDLPDRQTPAKAQPPQTAAELVQAGWMDFLFARFTEAGNRFRQALEKDPKSAGARLGLAFLNLDADPPAAVSDATAATLADPLSGLAQHALAVAAERSGDRTAALDAAWKAALDPATAVAGRALAAKLYSQMAAYQQVVETLAATGPWQSDPVCRNRLAFAHWKLGNTTRALRLTRQNLTVNPLDTFALSLLWLAGSEAEAPTLRQVFDAQPVALLDLAAEYAGLGQDETLHRLLADFYVQSSHRDPLVALWTAQSFKRHAADHPTLAQLDRYVANTSAAGVFPYHIEALEPLRNAWEADPDNGKLALYLGHLLFHLGRHNEARALWQKAAELGAEPVIAYRALGMAAKTLDSDRRTARSWLEQANRADPADCIVARDLARILFEFADQASGDEKRALTVLARDHLQAAFEEGKGRSDFVSLLARAYSRLGDYAATARLLDSVRITIWEGAREAHDLFEEAHLALGDAQLEAGRAAEALAEFDRALEYPENLATGKLENAREAHIHYRRGNALAALGKRDEALAAWRLAANEPASGDTRKEALRQAARQALEKASSE